MHQPEPPSACLQSWNVRVLKDFLLEGGIPRNSLLTVSLEGSFGAPCDHIQKQKWHQWNTTDILSYSALLSPSCHLYVENELQQKQRDFHIPESRIHSASPHPPLKWYFLFLHKANGRNPKILLKFRNTSLESKRSKKINIQRQTISSNWKIRSPSQLCFTAKSPI